MYTSFIGRRFLDIYSKEKGKETSPQKFFEKEIFEKFFNHEKYFKWVVNSPFVQKLSAEDKKAAKTFSHEQKIKLKIFYAKAGWLKKPSTEGSWLMQGKLSGGGVFLDLGIVMLDLALWMTGYPEVSRVSATDYSHKTKVEDSSVAYITMKNGTTITIEVSWNFHIENELYYCNIYGEQGSGKINPLMIHKEMHGNVVNVTPVKTDTSQNAIKKSYENELKHFVGAVRGIHQVISTAQEAVQRMKIVEAIYKSADKGKEIYFK